jgi:8-oxo-dGTP pyrophosphatase MutT (NUDIX family)
MPSHSLDVLARLQPEVPAALAARLESWVPGTTPAVPRRSASVVLVRPVEAGIAVYLLHRHARMVFAASMVVFPGGGLDSSDDGPDPLRACAVRETLEETGVRLAPDELHDWAHWVTPDVEPRRFDTRFYLAALPPGQHARDVSGETERAAWTAPTDALAAAERGEIGLMPPTLSILTELADAGSVPRAMELARDRVVVTVRPQLVQEGSQWRFVYPGSEGAS